jgi:hypothetical protein
LGGANLVDESMLVIDVKMKVKKALTGEKAERGNMFQQHIIMAAEEGHAVQPVSFRQSERA